jgi:hypothetical protein
VFRCSGPSLRTDIRLKAAKCFIRRAVTRLYTNVPVYRQNKQWASSEGCSANFEHVHKTAAHSGNEKMDWLNNVHTCNIFLATLFLLSSLTTSSLGKFMLINTVVYVSRKLLSTERRRHRPQINAITASRHEGSHANKGIVYPHIGSESNLSGISYKFLWINPSI